MVKHDTQAEHIYFIGVALPGKHLRCEIPWRTALLRKRSIIGRELREPEIGYLNIVRILVLDLIYQDVVRLDVSVNDVRSLEKVKGQQ